LASNIPATKLYSAVLDDGFVGYFSWDFLGGGAVQVSGDAGVAAYFPFVKGRCHF